MHRHLLPDLFHVAERQEWEAAVDEGRYTRSTRAASLEDVGFVHTSFLWQVLRVADLLYPEPDLDLLLLRIDVARLDVPVRVEPVEGGTEGFPHLYGPLLITAVVEVFPLPQNGGRYVLPAALDLGSSTASRTNAEPTTAMNATATPPSVSVA